MVSWVLGLFSLLALWPTARADGAPTPDEIKRLLEHMSQAQRSLSYSGTFVYLRDNRLDTLSISHQVRDGEAEERLVSLSGTLREVHRDPRAATAVLPDLKAASIVKRAPEMGLWPTPELDLGRLADQYLLHPLGQTRVAGRGVRVVGIIPKDTFRYGYRFYIDKETGLPLKTDLMDENARPIEQIMFTALDLKPDQAAATAGAPAQQEGSRKALRDAPKPQTLASAPDWRFVDAPAGFRLQLHNHWTDQDGKGMEHFVLSDGLASLSIYLEPGDADGLQGGAQVGAVHACGRRSEGQQVTAVGEVPEGTVRRVVETFRHRPAEP
jgi:sigma-E factor negative regulatory protein RseB